MEVSEKDQKLDVEKNEREVEENEKDKKQKNFIKNSNLFITICFIFCVLFNHNMIYFMKQVEKQENESEVMRSFSTMIGTFLIASIVGLILSVSLERHLFSSSDWEWLSYRSHWKKMWICASFNVVGTFLWISIPLSNCFVLLVVCKVKKKKKKKKFKFLYFFFYFLLFSALILFFLKFTQFLNKTKIS